MFQSNLIQSTIKYSCAIINSSIRPFHTATVLYAEPLRKKKQINPLTTKKQFERKVRRLEREINRLESIPLKLKPILEQQLPTYVVRDINKYRRQPDENQSEDLNIDELNKLQIYLNKIWSIYKGLETREEMRRIESVVRSQEKALNVLKNNYPDLYMNAIEIDPQLIPYQIMNVKKHTPPNPSYQCPDGQEQDITKEWRL